MLKFYFLFACFVVLIEAKCRFEHDCALNEYCKLQVGIRYGICTPVGDKNKTASKAPPTQKPATQKPTTQKTTTQKATTQKPETQKPTTQKPETQKATTQKPTTKKTEAPSKQHRLLSSPGNQQKCALENHGKPYGFYHRDGTTIFCPQKGECFTVFSLDNQLKQNSDVQGLLQQLKNPSAGKSSANELRTKLESELKKINPGSVCAGDDQ